MSIKNQAVVSSLSGRGFGLTTLAPAQPYSLPIFLQFCNQSIALLNYISVLLVFVVWSVGFDNAVDPINSARNSVCCNEFGEVPRMNVNMSSEI